MKPKELEVIAELQTEEQYKDALKARKTWSKRERKLLKKIAKLNKREDKANKKSLKLTTSIGIVNDLIAAYEETHEGKHEVTAAVVPSTTPARKRKRA
jgi:predicted  nucleic acid-binding Zn-ribbon protein